MISGIAAGFVVATVMFITVAAFFIIKINTYFN